VQASRLFSEAEDEAPRIQELYSTDAAEAISYGTFMKVQLQGKDTANGVLGRMLSWLYANVEFSAAALATELSVTRWADDDQFGFAGDHVWLPGTQRIRLCFCFHINCFFEICDSVCKV
jgi:hypothetical protein